MQVLKPTFNLLMIFGCWRPHSWSSLHKRLAYDVYTSTIFLLVNTFMISQLVDVILTLSNAEDISDNFFTLIALCSACCKLLVLLINRKSIIMLVDILMDKPCRPSELTEIKILYKFDKSIQINTWRFIHLGIVTVSIVILSSLFMNFRNKKLMYKAWVPFDYSSAILFYITYTHQMIGMIAAIFLSIGCDTLICGLLFHICCQIEILTYRLKKIISYSSVLRDCVYQHYHIFKFAVIVNAKFSLTITVQFVMSTMMICFSLYHLSKTTSKAKYLETILYMCCMLTQLFLYCWYGNEVKVKCSIIIKNTCWKLFLTIAKHCLRFFFNFFSSVMLYHFFIYIFGNKSKLTTLKLIIASKTNLPTVNLKFYIALIWKLFDAISKCESIQIIKISKSYEMVEKIFEIKWMTLNENSKKSLMIIMKRALVPIQIKCAYTIPMNLNSFMNILKMSYSTYNLLQHMDK